MRLFDLFYLLENVMPYYNTTIMLIIRKIMACESEIGRVVYKLRDG